MISITTTIGVKMTQQNGLGESCTNSVKNRRMNRVMDTLSQAGFEVPTLEDGCRAWPYEIEA